MEDDFQDFLSALPTSIPTTLQEPPLRAASRLALPPGSMVVECGVFRGASLDVLARAYPAHRVLGFDSFEGLPESWGRPDMAFDRGAFALGQDERPTTRHFPPNVQLVKGWFDETLPAFAAAAAAAHDVIGFLHVDCDIYSSTRTVLETLEPLFAPRTVVVFDELLNYPTYEKHEVRALFEFLRDRPAYDVEWLGKVGNVDLHPARDNGYADQPVACVLLRKVGGSE